VSTLYPVLPSNPSLLPQTTFISPRQPDRQYEQPGELVTLPSGIQYRELAVGTGKAAKLGALCEMSYTVYRLSSGAYYKYSSGGATRGIHGGT